MKLMGNNPYASNPIFLAAVPTVIPNGCIATINGGGGQSVNNTTVSVGFLFKAPETGTIDTVRFLLSSKSGTGGALSVCLFSCNGDGTVGAEVTTNSGLAVTAVVNQWQNYTLTNTFNVTKNVSYYLVIKNLDGAAASNNVGIVYVSSLGNQYKRNLSAVTYNGTTWTYNNSYTFSCLLEFSSPLGAWTGSPISTSTSLIYGLDAPGAGYALVKTPPVGLNVIGITTSLYKIGTPNTLANIAIDIGGARFLSESFDATQPAAASHFTVAMQDIVRIPPSQVITIGTVGAYVSAGNYCTLTKYTYYPNYAKKIGVSGIAMYGNGLLLTDTVPLLRLHLDPANPYFMPLNRRQFNSMR